MGLIVCEMCGYRFDESEHEACQNCPLQKECSLICCPNCGYEMVNVHKSKLARWAARLLSKGHARHPLLHTTLADLTPGRSAQVIGFSPSIPMGQQAHLQAYGITPGRLVHVLQHEPVTVVQVEHLELALEDDLAREVYVAGNG